MQKTKVSKRVTNGSKTALAEKAQTFFDFDELDCSAMRDDSRQVITKKVHFPPTNGIGVITKAERINFAKKDEEGSGKRGEIVVDVKFLYDVKKDSKSVDETGVPLGPFKRIIGRQVVDYSTTSVRVHLPKRFQKKLMQLDNLTLLVGCIICTPVYDSGKWIDKKNENK